MRNKFVYSYKVKIHALQFNEVLGHFLPLLVVEVFSLQKAIKILEEESSLLPSCQVNMADE